MLNRYESTWPPEGMVHASWSNVDSWPCCAEYLNTKDTWWANADDDGDENSNIGDYYYCDGTDLISRHG
jgi:hypothetical protein